MIDAAQAGWTAGILDLKAVTVIKANKMRATPQLVLSVEHRDPAIAAHLAKLTGTAAEPRPLVTKHWVQRPCTDHCPEAHVDHEQPSWRMPPTTRWSVTGVAAAVILWNTAPLMVERTCHAPFLEEAIASARLSGQGSGMTKAALARLRDLGWPMPPEFASVLGTRRQPPRHTRDGDISSPALAGWAAGALDVRGHAGTYRHTKSSAPVPVLRLEGTEHAVIAEFGRLAGMSPGPGGERESKDWWRHPCSQHCPEAHSHHEGETFLMAPKTCWRAAGSRAAGSTVAVILATLLPWMVTDRDFSEALAKAATRIPLTGKGTGMALASLRRLADLGWEMPPEFEAVLASTPVLAAV